MPKVSPLQSDFSSGEFSPFLEGRVGSDRYKNALKKCLNLVPVIQGYATRKPGERYIFNTKDNGVARLKKFEFSITQAYMIEFGDNYVRFFKDTANITLPSQNITNITKANPAVATYSGSDTYQNGDRIIIEGVIGMTQVNNREFAVANVNSGANTFELSGINSTSYDTYSSGGTISEIYEIASPYDVLDVFALKFTQSADVLYITHPSYKPKKLIRHDHTDWEFMDLDLQDGPYFPTNTTQDTVTPSAATGNGVTLTVGPDRTITGAASAAGLIRIASTAHGYLTGDKVFISGVTGTVEANGTWQIIKFDDDHFDLKGSVFVNAYVANGDAFPAVFVSTDVGRLIRVKEGTHWGWAKITAFTDPHVVTIDIQETFTNTNAKTDFRLGIYSDTTGYPSTLTFHEDRLILAGAPGAGQHIDGSKVGDYEIFSPTEFNGSVVDDNAISFAFNSNDVNVVRWLSSDEQGLLVGAVAGEWVVKASSQNEALTPSNITAKRVTSFGSDDIQPVQAGKATIFIQRFGRKVRELNYYFDINGFRASDLTQLANHISPNGIKQIAYAKDPHSIVWAVRNDGVLAGMTYDRDVDGVRVGWHRHILGGVSDAAGSAAIVESVETLPSSDLSHTDTWLVVKRYVNGQVVRHISYITKFFDDIMEQRDAFFVDAGLTFDNPISITNITKANPAVVTAAGHGMSNGDKISIVDVKGMIEVNTNTYLVAGVSGATFQLHSLTDVAVNSTGFHTYVSGGAVRKLISTLSGLNHLEGELVDILADGAVEPSKTVTNGKITLQDSAATIHVGYGYKTDGQLLRIDAGSADGTSLGKTRRSHRVGLMLYRSLGIKIGWAFDKLTAITFRKTSDKLTRMVPLFSGIISETTDADYDFDNTFCFRQDQPLPLTVLAVMPQMIEFDRD